MAASGLVRIATWLAPDIPPRRPLEGLWAAFAKAIGVAFSLFFLYAAAAVMAFPLFLGSYFAFTGALTFLLYPATARSPRTRPSAADLLLALVTVVVVVYFIVQFEELLGQAGRVGRTEFVLGALAILVSLEMCRRVLGPILPGLALLFILYDVFGPYFPGGLAHKGIALAQVISYSYSSDGIFGVVTSVYATYVFLFILFGAFIQRSGLGDLFMDLALALVGWARGGAAKAAVIGSALVGTILGSGAANVVVTGTFTIPLMKRAGFRPHFAGAVEAVASLGGHLMPPVMGAAAFVVAAFAERDYWEIAKLSFIPAVLYYVSLFAAIHFHSGKMGIRGLPREELPRLGDTLRGRWFLLTPLAVLVGMLALGFTAYYACLWSIASAVVASSLRRETRLSLRGILGALAEGAFNSLVVGVTGGVMGIVLAGVLLPGLGLRFSSLILSYSYGFLPLAYVLIVLVSYVLGMGMTIVASYIVLAILAIPALQELGVPLLAAHLLLLWVSQDAAISPPFAVVAFVAAGLAGSNPMRTGFTSLRLAKPLYIVPLLFMYTPILMDGPWPEVVATWVSSALGMVAGAAALEGYLVGPVGAAGRVLLAAAAVLLFWPAYWTDLAGLALAGAVLFANSRLQERVPAPVVKA